MALQKTLSAIRSKLPEIVLIFFSVFLFLFQLNSTYLTNWDEAWHAVIARNMARSGDFVTPIYNAKIWFATAPLYLWLVAIWFQLTNFSVLGVRLFSTIAGLGTVYLTYLIGRKLDNRRTGLVAAFILATTIQFLFRARQGNLDAPLAFFNTLALYSFIKGKDQPRWYYLLGISTGLGFLTKSVLGLFPFLTIVFIKPRHWLKFFNSFLLITGPWHIAAYLTHGQSFIRQYFLQYAFTKATNANPVSGTETFWYLGVLKHGLKIWIISLPLALIYTCFQTIKTKAQTKYLLPLLWVALPFIFLTLARMRNDWYIISIYPGIALLIALFLNQLYKFTSKQILTFALTLLIISVGVINITKYRTSYIVPETVAAEVQLASKAKTLSKPNETILLDDNYLPVAIFYSDRHIIPLRFSRSYESLVQDESLKIATDEAKLVLTNNETLEQLLEATHTNKYTILDTADDKLLIKLNY